MSVRGTLLGKKEDLGRRGKRWERGIGNKITSLYAYIKLLSKNKKVGGKGLEARKGPLTVCWQRNNALLLYFSHSIDIFNGHVLRIELNTSRSNCVILLGEF